MKRKAAIVDKKRIIEWRSHEPSRLETFSDAVFAFAVTLIIVSLEVPKTFTELYETMKGTFCFAVCFAILFNIWNNQNIFFRRFGLNDRWTVTLNGLLLFVVLIYVYPLKFLFGLVFFNNTYSVNGHPHEMIATLQVPTLMFIYGAGFTVIYILFCLMYVNAKKRRAELNLTEVELFETETEMYMNMICAGIGTLAILLAWVLPVEYSGLSGYFYTAIGPAYYIWFSHRGKKSRNKFGLSELPVS